MNEKGHNLTGSCSQYFRYDDIENSNRAEAVIIDLGGSDEFKKTKTENEGSTSKNDYWEHTSKASQEILYARWYLYLQCGRLGTHSILSLFTPTFSSAPMSCSTV